jgi:hypothetical protein
MNRIESILAQDTTKTGKIQQLILIGLTRTQIAALVTNGNYGFVQNVYAKMKRDGLLNAETQRAFNRRFGVEFEAYNVNMHTLADALNAAGIACEVESYNHAPQNYWKIVTDSSLSGNNTFELVSPILQGNAGLEQLKTVCRVLGECGAKVNKSCGTHVHFDAAGFDIEMWKRLYINYFKLENIIDGFMPPSRRENTYCRGLRNIANFEARIGHAANIDEIATVFHNDRYYKINPVSYARHKTCEFRQHGGTVEYEKISNWILFLNNLIGFSKNSLISDPSLDGLRNFNDENIVTYYKTRTNKFAA